MSGTRRLTVGQAVVRFLAAQRSVRDSSERPFFAGVLGIFSDAHPVIAVGTGPMKIVSAMGWVIAIGMILTQALFGAGNTRFVMIAELCLHFCCLVPLAWLFGIKLQWGLVGIWSAALTYVVLLTTAMVLKFRSGDWKGIKI